MAAARELAVGLARLGGHRFLADDVSITDPDVPTRSGHGQMSDAHLLTPARRHHVRLVTFDPDIRALGHASAVELSVAP